MQDGCHLLILGNIRKCICPVCKWKQIYKLWDKSPTLVMPRQKSIRLPELNLPPSRLWELLWQARSSAHSFKNFKSTSFISGVHPVKIALIFLCVLIPLLSNPLRLPVHNPGDMAVVPLSEHF